LKSSVEGDEAGDEDRPPDKAARQSVGIRPSSAFGLSARKRANVKTPPQSVVGQLAPKIDFMPFGACQNRDGLEKGRHLGGNSR
jgi:hypothetical protein